MLNAACEGMNPADFTYTSSDAPGYEPRRYPDGKWAKERGSNRIRMEEARKTCLICPVRTECLESANGSDKFWSVRGGVMPVVLEPGRHYAPSADMKPYVIDPCPAGHLGAWRPRANGKGRNCKMCEDDYREAYATAQKETHPEG